MEVRTAQATIPTAVPQEMTAHQETDLTVMIHQVEALTVTAHPEKVDHQMAVTMMESMMTVPEAVIMQMKTPIRMEVMIPGINKM